MPGPSPLPPLEQILDSATLVSVPLHVRFRGVDERAALILQGPRGTGEFAPFPEYEDREAARWLASALEAGWGSWPEPVRDRVSVNATVPSVPASAVPDVLARFDGCTTAKVKVAEVGQSLDDDLARVAAVRDVMGEEAFVRVDANGGWAVDEAERALTELSAFGLQYAEQPCRGVEDLVELRVRLDAAGIGITLAADESIRRAEDPHRVARSGAVGVVVLKVAPLGGVGALVELGRDLVRQYGVATVVSSALDTSVGLAAGVAAAAALEQVDWASGLGTARLLAGDVCAEPLAPMAGYLPVTRPTVSPDLLSRWEVRDSRREWWRDRLRRCYALLATSTGGGFR